jgi:hypothetical protein
MAKLYYRKITTEDIHPITGEKWTINDVPERWKGEVQELLEGNNGN